MVGMVVANASVLSAAPAAAHPTDEVVQQVYLTPTGPGLTGLTVQLDLTPGVLVAPRFAGAIDVDGGGTLSAAEVDAHAAAVRAAVNVRVDGVVADLSPGENRYPPVDLLAAGGGTVSLTWTARLPARAGQVVVTDRYDPGRSTVQMSVLMAPEPVTLGPIRHADGGRTMAVALAPGAAPSTADAANAAVTVPATTGGSMLDALRRPLTSPWALLALLGACTALGALHALTPGHGKTLLAGYLVGDRGTPGQAVRLGAMITVTHTGAVIALGGAVLAADRYIVPGVVVPVLSVVAGVVVLVLGLRLVRRRWPGTPVLGHGHGHGHEHGHEHGHIARVGGLRGLAAIGLAAGMIPCPEALSVLLLAIGLNRTALGMAMVVAFSVGLAAVLVGLGLLLVTAAPTLARFGGRRSGWLATRVPLLSALVVTVLGCAMTVNGVNGLIP